MVGEVTVKEKNNITYRKNNELRENNSPLVVSTMGQSTEVIVPNNNKYLSNDLMEVPFCYPKYRI